MILKELIFHSSTLGGCGGLEKLILTVCTLGVCGILERTDFSQFLLLECVCS